MNILYVSSLHLLFFFAAAMSNMWGNDENIKTLNKHVIYHYSYSTTKIDRQKQCFKLVFKQHERRKTETFRSVETRSCERQDIDLWIRREKSVKKIIIILVKFFLWIFYRELVKKYLMKKYNSG